MFDLTSRWKKAFEEYPTLKQQTEAEIVRWEWAKGQRYHPIPLYFERQQQRPARLLSAAPDNPLGHWQYGFDAAGRLRLVRYHAYPAPLMPAHPVEEIFRCQDHAVESVRYIKPGLPVEVAVQQIEDGRIAAYHAITFSLGAGLRITSPEKIFELAVKTGGITRCDETYRYQDGRLARIGFHYENSGGPAPFVQHWDEIIHYDAAGQVVQIERRRASGASEIVYRKPEKKRSLKALAAYVRDRLAECIPAALARADVEGRAYCIVLYYREQFITPTLLLGLEADREALIAAGDPSLRYSLWMPVGDGIPVSDLEQDATAQLFEQQMNLSQGWERGRAMLREVAAILMQRDWSGVLDVTPDLAIYAMDYELDDLEDSMAASVPPARLVEFRAKGWL